MCNYVAPDLICSLLGLRRRDNDDDNDDPYRFTGPLRQAHRQEPKCLHTLFVDGAMQADIGSRRFGSVDVDIMTDLRVMLESCNSYHRFWHWRTVTVGTAAPFSQSGATGRPSAEYRACGRYNVPTSNEQIAILMTGNSIFIETLHCCTASRSWRRQPTTNIGDTPQLGFTALRTYVPVRHCHFTTSVWQTSTRRAANATPSQSAIVAYLLYLPVSIANGATDRRAPVKYDSSYDTASCRLLASTDAVKCNRVLNGLANDKRSDLSFRILMPEQYIHWCIWITAFAYNTEGDYEMNADML